MTNHFRSARWIVVFMWIALGAFASAQDQPKPDAQTPPPQSPDRPSIPAVKITLDTSQAPDMAQWAEESKAICEKAFPMIVEHLGAPGFDPPTEVRLVFKRGRGIAAASGRTITCIDEWFKAHPDDYGAVVHEMCHVVQAYGRSRVPGWVTEGIADYVRWFNYEPANRRPRVNPNRAKYTDSYQTTAAFFDWIVRTKDKTFVNRLNNAARKGQYKPELFQEFAGASVDDLWAEFIESVKKARLPNVVIVFTDDQGYQDVGCFGSPDIQTPNLDRMAQQGMRFTDFYVAQAVCSASRVALMTGCYSNRVGILGALGPRSKIGIHQNEMTLAEVVKQRGYATAIYGKWHLGDQARFLPVRHGFDEYFGIPYSNDMGPLRPGPNDARPPIPMVENDNIVATSPDQTKLTTWYTEHAVRFIEKNKDRPFLVYLAHNMPHVPIHVSDKFQGKSPRGLYGDVIMEIDWSVGQILETLARLGLDEKTLVIFTSDNGPWLNYGDHAGRALPLREGKGTMFDGGCREACIMRWPGRIPAGAVCKEVAGTIDILPTLAELVGAELPKDHAIDGRSILPLMQGRPGAKSPREAQYFYWNRELQAVRAGKWKLHFPHAYRTLDGEPGKGGMPGKYKQDKIGLALFDLENDIGETTNVAEQNPEVVKQLEALAEKAREDLGDSLTGREGKNVREPGKVEEK